MPGTIHTKDGRRIETLTFGAPLRLDDGSIHGGLAIWLDVTSQRSTERQLRQATKMEAVGQLTGGMAHDFNNILAVIIGNLDELVHTLPAGDPARALATEAIDAAERGTALTRRLLAFARRQTLLPVPTDLNALILGLAPLLRRAVGESVGVALDLATAVWPAQIDPGQLESAILNLAVNGRDAMPQGGTLSVETRNAVVTEDDQTRDPGQRPGDYVRVSVIDTGVGIPPALLSRVLEPFFTTKDSSKGSGLGLSMAFGFARQSGGALRIESIEGQGTRVSLDLPRCADAQDPDSAAPVVLAGNQELILIVEDDPMLRRITARNVAALGYRTLIAADAHAALSLLRAHPDISVLFTDIVLPDAMNGFDLARLAYAQRPDLRVLFTSGFVDHAAASGAMPDFGAQLLTKPFHRAQLGAALSACLARPAPASGRGGEESSEEHKDSGHGGDRA
jgi:signal transduction histidine kinase/ActR/RegA family two-component response regulator